VKLLSALHRWTGGLIGLLLAIIGLSGTMLVWEGSWIGVTGASDKVAEQPARIAEVVDRAAAQGMSRITFANKEIGLHQVINADGSGAYVRQDGSVVERWASQWQRPELWLFDLHHRLFSGASGETVTGITGLAGLLFVLTGLILWWRGRASFRPTLLPRRLAPGPITSHHRDLGLLAAPLLLLSMTTGVLMLFEPLRAAVIGEELRPQRTISGTPPASPGEALLRAKSLFPEAALRRIVIPKSPNGDLSVRLRQPFEWTPQGRTQIRFAPDGLLTIDDPGGQNGAAAVTEKLYPVHSAKIGGAGMRLLMTLSGLSLALLGTFAVYAFWLRKAKRWRRPRRKIDRSSGSLLPNQIT
jgi:uncharacterized iron-regulated membrane protein